MMNNTNTITNPYVRRQVEAMVAAGKRVTVLTATLDGGQKIYSIMEEKEAGR
jgi:hypothetical protein